MNKIRCFLVDDEPNALQALANIITRDFPILEIVGQANSVDQAEEGIRQTFPHVVFLDIVMPLQSGFELINRFESIPFEIVFITSHTEYALQAIQNLALAYLLKPVSTDEFAKMLAILQSRLELMEKKELYDTLIDNMSASHAKDQKLAITANNKTEFVRIGDIIHIEGWKRYTKIFTASRAYVSSYNVGKFSKMLVNQGFYICHKSHVINMDYVVSLLADDKIQITDQSLVPLATRKRSEFLKTFEKIHKKKA